MYEYIKKICDNLDKWKETAPKSKTRLALKTKHIYNKLKHTKQNNNASLVVTKQTIKKTKCSTTGSEFDSLEMWSWWKYHVLSRSPKVQKYAVRLI